MLHEIRLRLAVLTALAALACGLAGCTSPREYFRNGLKVGPSYGPPAAPLPKHWIDADDARMRQSTDNLSCWWGVFNDPLLNRLICNAYQQNLTLREAGFRVLQARALRSIAVGNIFPQQQTYNGSYNRIATTGLGPGRFFDAWNTDFNLSWELDFWGRFRRAVAAADDNLDASVGDYDQVIVTLLGDVAQNYVQIRTDQERIKLLWKNVKIQVGVLQFVENQYKAGFKSVTELDFDQALSNLRQTQAAIPQLVIDMRQSENRLCVLLGMPVVDLDKMLGIDQIALTQEETQKMSDEDFDKLFANSAPIPTVSPNLVINLPADLLRHRPDVRAAERRAAAQGEAIGIAEADLYPSFFINGTLGWSAQNLSDLFKTQSFNGNIGPSFQWNVLNYGRILNNVRLQDAHFRELVVTYQETVLQADEEVEDGIVAFLRSQQRESYLKESEEAAVKAVKIALARYQGGVDDFNRYAVIQQNLVTQQDAYAQSVGQIAQGLILVYRALGGGWEIRFAGPAMMPPMMPAAMPAGAPPTGPNGPAPQAPEALPAPNPNIPPVPTEIPKPSEQPQK